MKYLPQRLLLLIIAISYVSCEKDEVGTTPLASIAIVNAVNGGSSVRLGSNAITVSNNGSAQLAIVAGTNNLYVWPTIDTTKPYFTDAKFVAKNRGVYTLFLTGTVTAPEGILVEESIPYHTDSTAGIRFVNLVPSSMPLNITLSTSTTTNEVSNLAYKQYTDFKTYPGLYNSAYTFQVRAANNPGTVLTTFALTSSTVPRFANITVVIRQNAGGVATFRVNHDR